MTAEVRGSGYQPVDVTCPHCRRLILLQVDRFVDDDGDLAIDLHDVGDALAVHQRHGCQGRRR